MTVLGQIARRVQNAVAPLRSRFNDHVRHTTLANGLNVLSQKSKRGDQVDFVLRINVGSYDDPDHQKGIAHFLEHGLFSNQIMQGFEDRSGYINARTSPEEIVIKGSIENTPDNLRFMMTSLGQMMTAPVDPEHFEKEKNRIRNEIGMRADNPLATVGVLHSEILDGHNGFDIAGSRADIEKLTLKDISDFRDKWFKAPGMILAVSGVDNHFALHRLASKSLGDIPADTPPDVRRPVITPREVRQANDNLNQVYLDITYPLNDLSFRDRKIATLASNYIREAVHREIVREKGLSYASGLQAFWDTRGTGIFTVGINVLPEQGDRILSPIADIIGKASVHIDEALFKRVKMDVQKLIPPTDKDKFSQHEPDALARDFAERGYIERNSETDSIYSSITSQEVADFIHKMAEQTPALITYGNADKIQNTDYFVTAVRAAQRQHATRTAENRAHIT